MFTVNSHINSPIYGHYKIEIADSRSMKICKQTKPGLRNPIRGQKFRIRNFKTFQNEAVSENEMINVIVVYFQSETKGI